MPISRTMSLAFLRGSVRNKLFAGFGLLIVVLAVVVIVATSAMGTLGSSHNKLSHSVLPRVNAAAAVRAAGSDMHFSQTEYVLDGGKSRENYEGDHATFEEALAKLRDVSRGTASEPRYRAIDAAAKAFDAGDAKLLAAVKAGDAPQATDLVRGAQNALADGLVEAATAYQDHAAKEDKAADAAFASTKTRSERAMYAIALATLLLAAGLAWLLSRGIVGGVRQALRGARAIARGEVDQD